MATRENGLVNPQQFFSFVGPVEILFRERSPLESHGLRVAGVGHQLRHSRGEVGGVVVTEDAESRLLHDARHVSHEIHDDGQSRRKVVAHFPGKTRPIGQMVAQRHEGDVGGAKVFVQVLPRDGPRRNEFEGEGAAVDAGRGAGEDEADRGAATACLRPPGDLMQGRENHLQVVKDVAGEHGVETIRIEAELPAAGRAIQHAHILRVRGIRNHGDSFLGKTKPDGALKQGPAHTGQPVRLGLEAFLVVGFQRFEGEIHPERLSQPNGSAMSPPVAPIDHQGAMESPLEAHRGMDRRGTGVKRVDHQVGVPLMGIGKGLSAPLDAADHVDGIPAGAQRARKQIRRFRHANAVNRGFAPAEPIRLRVGHDRDAVSAPHQFPGKMEAAMKRAPPDDIVVEEKDFHDGRNARQRHGLKGSDDSVFLTDWGK